MKTKKQYSTKNKEVVNKLSYEDFIAKNVRF